MPTPQKYAKLKDLDFVTDQLRTKSMQQLAEELGCPASSVRWVVERYLSQDQKAQIKYQRKPHQNKKKVQSPLVEAK